MADPSLFASKVQVRLEKVDPELIKQSLSWAITFIRLISTVKWLGLFNSMARVLPVI